MSRSFKEIQNNLIEIRHARDQAESLHNQLLAEYQRICQENTDSQQPQANVQLRQQGLEAMRKAIAAANNAIASIGQALRKWNRPTAING